MLRALSLIWLVLVLATGSVTMALARHQMRAVGQTVICTGYGSVTLSVDANGRPTGPRQPCPDCTPALAALAAVTHPTLRAPSTLRAQPFPPPGASLVSGTIPAHARARAPPVGA